MGKFLSVALDDDRYNKLSKLKNQYGFDSMSETIEFLIDGIDIQI